MWSNIIVIVSLFSLVTPKKPVYRQNDNAHPTRNPGPLGLHSRQRSKIDDPAIANFVDSLLASEKYLKIMDAKITHLDETLQEKANTALKYLTEILALTNKSSADELESVLKDFKLDLDHMKQILLEQATQATHIRHGK